MCIKIVNDWLESYNIEPREYAHAGTNYDIDFTLIEKDIMDYCEDVGIKGKLKIDNDYPYNRDYVIDGGKSYEFIRDYSVGKEKFYVVDYEEEGN